MNKLGFGLMRLPVTDAGDPKSIDQELVNRMVDAYMAEGFTYFDTGYPYHQGMSEVAARKAIVERYPRESFTLTDKMPTFFVTKSSDYQRFFDEQLERCGVTYFDYYLLHNLGVKSYAETVELGGFEFMTKLKREGKVRKIGFSFHDKADLLDRILTEHPEMEYVQLQINYIDWESEGIEARRCYEVATRHSKPVIVMEPVKGGALANVPELAEKILRARRPEMSPAAWALRFAASLDNVFMVLSGMSTLDQVTENTGSLRDTAPFGPDEQEAIARATQAINGSIAVPCTACQYCVDGCPKNIPIPRYFSLYNDQRRFGSGPVVMAYYMNLTHDFGKASDCVACGQCEEHCPQHLPIVECLKDVATAFGS